MKYIVLLSLLLIFQSSYSQIGKPEYLTAKSYYDAGDYTNSLAQLTKVESLLGESNGAIEHLRVKCYFNLGKTTESKNALIDFCKYPSSDVIISEMKQYEMKLKLAELAEPLQRLKKQQLEIEKLINSRISYVSQKISEKDIEIKQFIKYGTGEYRLAMKDGSIELLEKFLVDFPNSIHVDSVRNR